MKLSNVGEFGLISTISSLCRTTESLVLLGIGDDAAVLTFKANKVLATTDMLIEGIHFDLNYTTFFQLGFKTLAVSVSDIAAMGGRPEYFFLCLGIPPFFETKWIEELYKGINALAIQTQVHVTGGDTCSARSGNFVLSGFLLGSTNKFIRRSGAQVGDTIYITNKLGDSAAGLALLQAHGKTANFDDKSFDKDRFALFEPLVRRHLMPTPRFMIDTGEITAMIDISDGLLQDLGHICEQSGTGARIYLNNIPLSDALKKASQHLNRDPLDFALNGGEDYELLFTSSASFENCIAIGEITNENRIMVDKNNQTIPVELNRGYDHFKVS